MNSEKEFKEIDAYSIFMQVPMAVCIFRGKDLVIEFANDFYLQILNKDDSIVGKPLFESFPELINTGFETFIGDIIKSGLPSQVDEHEVYIVKNKKREQYFFRCNYQPLKNKTQLSSSVIVVFTDITEEVKVKNINIENRKELADKLGNANKELAYQDDEKEKRANELGIANQELIYQNELKEKRAEELDIANKELIFQNNEKEKRADELSIANIELAFQNNEKEKRADELSIANEQLAFQNNEKEKRANELSIANKELAFQDEEKEKRANELSIANKELIFQTREKDKRAAELVIADIELAFQNKEKEKREIANKELEVFSYSLKSASQYSRSLIEASLDPLVTISAEGKITDVNEASIKVTGILREELINTDFSDYFTEPKKAQQGYRQVFEKGFVSNYPLTIKNKNGKLTDVLYNASVYKDDQGKVLGVFAAARDVTAQKVIEQELIEAKVFAEEAKLIAEEAKNKAETAQNKAESAVKAKQQFLSNMSHEIRTPMNAIIGFTKVLMKTDLTAKQKEYLSAIKMSGDSLIVLINDILDLAKVDAGKMTFEQIPFKLSSSISSLIHIFETKVQEKNIELITEYDNSIPDTLIGDSVRLNQIILNLVSNAVKFTQIGSITVGTKLLHKSDTLASIEFFVSDTGIGISKDKVKSIFENFNQASSSTSRLYGGTGLGLAIVKHLVEALGGTIEVESKVNTGSTFHFVLDYKIASKEDVIDVGLLEPDLEIKNIKVLVAEDMALNQLLMKTLLDDFGFERDIVSNGKIAIEKLKSKSYDIILMDLQMPEMNGFEATNYIRNTMNSNIPIIALTADVTTVDLEKCKQLGMNDYIAKPIDERILYSKIVGLVKKSSWAARNFINPTYPEILKEELKKYTDLSYLHTRTKSNPVLMMEMISIYLEQTPDLILKMKQSIKDKDWSLLHSAAHKMIPSFSIMGIHTDFEDIAKRIQDYAILQEQTDGIDDLILQIEKVCLYACKELEAEYNIFKINMK